MYVADFDLSALRSCCELLEVCLDLPRSHSSGLLGRIPILTQSVRTLDTNLRALRDDRFSSWTNPSSTEFINHCRRVGADVEVAFLQFQFHQDVQNIYLRRLGHRASDLRNDPTHLLLQFLAS